VDHREAGRYWNRNADAWSELSRAGYNTSRDRVLNPCFFEMLPDVHGLRGLDIGCGDGDNTRLVAKRGASMTGLDIAPRFVAIAQQTEKADPIGVQYLCASAVELPFPDETFDFAVALVSLMDVPEFDRALGEAFRVLRPGGFLQFSITHPCCDVPHRRKVLDDDGEAVAMELGGYFTGSSGAVLEWIFGAAPPEERVKYPPFRQPQLHHTLSEWLNALAKAGFHVEKAEEPRASEAMISQFPEERDSHVWPFFLVMRCRKATP
jgi:ubiquinone/menaquinone biosynthesis C-methylase UbiE